MDRVATLPKLPSFIKIKYDEDIKHYIVWCPNQGPILLSTLAAVNLLAETFKPKRGFFTQEQLDELELLNKENSQ